MNALSGKSVALAATLLVALMTGCADPDSSDDGAEGLGNVTAGNDVAQDKGTGARVDGVNVAAAEEPEDLPADVLQGEMSTRGISWGNGVAPVWCPKGKERFEDRCYSPCPWDYPVAHITMCFAKCNDGDFLDSPGNCRHRGGRIDTQAGGFNTVSNYSVASKDRGAGTPLVCAPDQTMRNGLCFGATNTPPQPVRPQPPQGDLKQPGAYDEAAYQCSLRTGYKYNYTFKTCDKVTAEDYGITGTTGAKPGYTAPLSCFGAQCPSKPTDPVITGSTPSTTWRPIGQCQTPGSCFPR